MYRNPNRSEQVDINVKAVCEKQVNSFSVLNFETETVGEI